MATLILNHATKRIHKGPEERCNTDDITDPETVSHTRRQPLLKKGYRLCGWCFPAAGR